MIFRSPYPDVEVPEVSFTEYVLRRADELAEKAALIDGPSGRTLTYGDVASGIRRAAGGLARRGFAKGDVLAIYSPNLPEYPIAFHAAASAGGIVTTVNPLYTAGELANQLNDCRAKFLVTIGPFLDKAREAARESPVEEIFVFGEAEGATPFADLLDRGELAEPPSIDPRTDLVVLPYSSGTTGLPKGVMLTHHNLVANMCQVEGLRDYRMLSEEDTLVGVLPFFHIYGMLVILNYGIARGATIVTMPRFEMEPFLEILEKHRVTFAHLVPPIVLGLAKHPAVDGTDLSSLTSVLCGAAPMGEELTQAAARRLGCTVTQGYGLTETSPVTHVSPNLPPNDKPASVGPSVPNTETMIVDVETGTALGEHQSGEVWIRGPQVMRGYLNQPQATAQTVDEDGWLHTGDIGFVDEDRCLYIVDRVKELIKYKGLQVAPAELEGVLLSHPDIADAAVVGSPDEEAGEVPKAFIVAKGELDEDEVKRFVAERVAPHKKVRRIELIDQIPKALSGKILRRVLVERERSSR